MVNTRKVCLLLLAALLVVTFCFSLKLFDCQTLSLNQSYCKTVLLNNLNQNPVKLSVHFGINNDSQNDIYLSGLSRPDFRDVVVSSTDNQTIDFVKGNDNLAVLNNTFQTLDNGAYNGFGFCIQTGPDKIIYFYRQATSHQSDKGLLMMRPYSISTNSWGGISPVFNDSVYDCRNIAGGVIGNNVYLFFSRWNFTGCYTVDSGYIVSADLNCKDWSTYTVVNYGSGSPYGSFIQKGNSTTWYILFYSIATDKNVLRVLRTNDNGCSWAFTSTIYSGQTKYTESCAVWCGNDKILVLSRNENGRLHQFISSDAGDTWVDVGDTNLGGPAINIPWAITFDCGFIQITWTDRTTNLQMVTEAPINYIFSAPQTYPSPIILYSFPTSGGSLGYCSLIELPDKSVFFVLNYQRNATDSEIVSGKYEVKTTFLISITTDYQVANSTINLHYGDTEPEPIITPVYPAYTATPLSSPMPTITPSSVRMTVTPTPVSPISLSPTAKLTPVIRQSPINWFGIYMALTVIILSGVFTSVVFLRRKSKVVGHIRR